ncbi:hypothetical protein IMZ48_01750 [Candidatus Bathyarchaeota archaeon]|nr:hypothetical protein [Candidatus Bathyarchaeota archaeon]
MASPMAVISMPLTHILGASLIVPWFICLVVCDIIFTALLPLKPLVPNAVYNISSEVICFAWTWIQGNFVSINGADIAVSGDAIPKGESGLVVSNHVCWSDFYMIQAVAIRAGMLSRLRYFAKVQLL